MIIIIGRFRGRARLMPPPYGNQFFHFCIHFCQKAPVSGVHTPPPQRVHAPPMGNPGSATDYQALNSGSIEQHHLCERFGYCDTNKSVHQMIIIQHTSLVQVNAVIYMNISGTQIWKFHH